MSIPLDRLYNFLYDRCDHDALIYHFYPHGSKNPKDIRLLQKLKNDYDILTLPQIVFHDQEPLQFNLWPEQPKNFLIPDVPHSRIKPFTSHHNLYDKLLLVHSEKNSIELKKFEDDGAIGVYYWSHALIARDWFRYAKYDLSLVKPKTTSKNFLIYNRAWIGTREYRLKFFELLVNHNLYEDCLTSFNPVDTNIHYRNYRFSNQSLSITNFNIENIFPENTYPSHASADYEAEDYTNTNIEIVLETLFDDNRLHLTEKCLRPVAAGHPFILCATPGSLAYLREYGFKTFDSVWDESYDSIDDPVERLECIIELMKSIQGSNLDYNKIKAITDHNKNRFFGNEFYNQVMNEFNENLSAGLGELEKFKSMKYFLRNYSFFKDATHSPLSDIYEKIYKMLDFD